MKKMLVGVLGATGMVGQRFVQLLENHPWFEVAAVGASEQSAEKPYGEVMRERWKLPTLIPDPVADLTVRTCVPAFFENCPLIFSALDADVAGAVEESFAKAGHAVSSNASSHRMEHDVPLVIPEVNADHFGLIKVQQKLRGTEGFIVTNGNCSTIALVPVLKALMPFGLTKVQVVTMQAVSGAGYPGVASLDVLDNLIPYIGGEEKKLETEPLKILGRIENDAITPAAIIVSAQCNRVNVSDGHTACVSVELTSEPSLEEVTAALRTWNPIAHLSLPSAPPTPIVVRNERDRPQPRLDRDVSRGMATIVGRIRRDPVLGYKFVLLGHNTIRGAAGGAILNAELLTKMGS